MVQAELVKEEILLKDFQENITSECQIILVDLDKVKKILNNIDNNSFNKDLYLDFYMGKNQNDYYIDMDEDNIIKESHLKSLISVFGEKKISICCNGLHKALPYLFARRIHNNGKKIKDTLLKLMSIELAVKVTSGEINKKAKRKFFGWITKEEIEYNFMKLLEGIADIHETFKIEKIGFVEPKLTLSLLKQLYGSKNMHNYDTKKIAGEFEEIIKNIFYALRRAREYNLDIVLIEE
jgi:hypothetical protein